MLRISSMNIHIYKRIKRAVWNCRVLQMSPCLCVCAVNMFIQLILSYPFNRNYMRRLFVKACAVSLERNTRQHSSDDWCRTGCSCDGMKLPSLTLSLPVKYFLRILFAAILFRVYSMTHWHTKTKQETIFEGGKQKSRGNFPFTKFI